MKYIPRIILTFFITLLFPTITMAWNALGHMIIANIAYQQLKPEVRDKIDNLVTYMHQQYPDMETFIHLSYWPDAIRSQKIETYTHWHYINTAISNDGTPLKNLNDTDNAVWAVKHIEAVVKNYRANPYERVRFLSFLAHIVGDLHQPLHTVSSISTDMPDGDRGGNEYYVRHHNKRVKLHHVWDIGLDEFEGEASKDRVNIITNAIMTQYSEAYFGDQVNQLEPDDWVKEGVNQAKQYVYNTPQNQALSAQYIDQGKVISKQQVALAGYRLAKILNQLMM